jgi:hypothetical protein
MLHWLGYLFSIHVLVWITRHFRSLDQLIELRALRA